MELLGKPKIFGLSANNPTPTNSFNWTNPLENTEFFVGWGTLSLINAGLAQAKGRSGFLWWLGSLFLGPIGTFLIVFLPPIAPPGFMK